MPWRWAFWDRSPFTAAGTLPNPFYRRFDLCPRWIEVPESGKGLGRARFFSGSGPTFRLVHGLQSQSLVGKEPRNVTFPKNRQVDDLVSIDAARGREGRKARLAPSCLKGVEIGA